MVELRFVLVRKMPKTIPLATPLGIECDLGEVWSAMFQESLRPGPTKAVHIPHRH